MFTRLLMKSLKKIYPEILASTDATVLDINGPVTVTGNGYKLWDSEGHNKLDLRVNGLSLISDTTASKYQIALWKD